jgi:hypothetical protein
MPNTTTNYLYLMALSIDLKRRFVTDLAPAINNGISTYLIGNDNEPIAGLPSFGAANIVRGNQISIAEPTICIYTPYEQNQPFFGNEMGRLNWVIYASLRVPYVVAAPATVGDEPEAFDTLGILFVENVRSYFSQLGTFTITPKNKAGQNTLPSDAATIQQIAMTGFTGWRPGRDAAGSLKYWSWDCSINAVMHSGFQRADTVQPS